MQLLPALRVGCLRMTLPVVGVERRGVEFLERPVRAALNPPESTGMGFWSLNPYVGCEFGCSYCYARFAHRYGVERAAAAGTLTEATRARLARLEHPWLAFERAIFVKRAAELTTALRADLGRVVRRRSGGGGVQTIAIGTSTDPYQPAERTFRLTRRALELMLEVRGVRISLVTKSPLVTRDAELLRAIAERNEVAVHLSLISTDRRLIRAVEPRTPLPHARLRAVRRLADAGVPVGIFCAPVLPGITDDVRGLRELFRAARDAGATFAPGCAVRIYGGAREPLVQALERSFPALVKRYEQRFRRAREAPEAYRAGLSRRMRRLRREFGLKAAPFGPDDGPAAEQLAFWG